MLWSKRQLEQQDISNKTCKNAGTNKLKWKNIRFGSTHLSLPLWFMSLLFLQDTIILSHTLLISFEVVGNSKTEYSCIFNKKARKYILKWFVLLGFLKSSCVLYMCLYQGANKYVVEVPQGTKKYGFRLLKQQ